jgi:hypothetical protein
MTIRIAAFLSLLVVQGASAACLQPAGDVTQDGNANVIDVQCLITVALWSVAGEFGPAPYCLGVVPTGADLDCDGVLAVTDVQLAIVHALGGALDPTLDADGDSCVDACLDPSVLACGHPDVPDGCLCAVSGPAGSLVGCPLCIASASDATHRGALLAGELIYDASRASLSELTDVQCFPAAGCFLLPVTGSGSYPLSTGHTVSTNPSLIGSADGTLVLVFVNLSDPTVVLSGAVTDGAGSVTSGDPTVMTIELELAEDVPKDDPVLACLDKLSIVDGAGRRVGSYVQGGIVTSGTPMAPPSGTHAGCPDVLGDFNGSGEANVSDVKCSLLWVLHEMADPASPWPTCTPSDGPKSIDADCSDSIDLVDIYVALLAALSAPLPPTLDANGDGCIDRCEPLP